MINFKENGRKHCFLHFTTFSRACLRRARFFPHKPSVPNHRVHQPPSSCKKLERSYDQFLRKWAKTSFLGIFDHIWACRRPARFFFKNLAPSLFLLQCDQSLCKISEKSHERFLRKTRTDRRTDGQTRVISQDPSQRGSKMIKFKATLFLLIKMPNVNTL